MSHVNTFLRFNETLLGLEEVQDWIDHARFVASTNQVVQLELDRKQTELNDRRELIKALMFDIASQN